MGACFSVGISAPEQPHCGFITRSWDDAVLYGRGQQISCPAGAHDTHQEQLVGSESVQHY